MVHEPFTVTIPEVEAAMFNANYTVTKITLEVLDKEPVVKNYE